MSMFINGQEINVPDGASVVASNGDVIISNGSITLTGDGNVVTGSAANNIPELVQAGTIMDNETFTGGRWDGVDFTNVTFYRCTFTGVKMNGSFTNVVFDNCTLTGVKVSGNGDILFKNSTLTGVKVLDSDTIDIRTKGSVTNGCRL